MNITARKISTVRKRYSSKSAMTLIELIVAVAIMIMIVAGVGYVFSATAKTVRTARTNAEINSSARSFAIQIREDLQRIDTNGFMAIVGPTATTPSMLMFTATGKFDPVSVRNVSASGIYYDCNDAIAHGQNALASGESVNSALIVYVPFKEAGANRRILMRFVYRLVGPTDIYSSGNIRPVYLQEQFMTRYGAYAGSRFTTMPEQQMAAMMTFGDFLFVGMDNIKSMVAYDDSGTYESIYANLVWPLAFMFDASGSLPEITSSPLDMEGVQDLWPYLVGGIPNTSDSFYIDFYDGRDEDPDGDLVAEAWDQRNGLTHESDDSNTRGCALSNAFYTTHRDAWMNVIDNSSLDRLGEARMGGSISNTALTRGLCVGRIDYPVAIWTGRNLQAWPKMLRFRLKQGDVASLAEKPKDFELLIPLR